MGVGVVGRADDDGVDVALLLQHLAEVGVALGVGEVLVGAGRALVVDVAQGDDVLGAGDGPQVAAALAAGADDGDVEPVVGPRPPLGRGRAAGRVEAHACRRSGLEEVSPTVSPTHHTLLGKCPKGKGIGAAG